MQGNIMHTRIEWQNWDGIAQNLDARGHALVPGILDGQECSALIDAYGTSDLYRKTVVMERHGYGKGEYRYYAYPLPDIVTALREAVYPRIAPVANGWMQRLGIDTHFPATHQELKAHCHGNGQTHPTALILKYGTDGFNALHQDLYGDIYFPMQLVLFLNDPTVDYSGGEFVLVEQVPRAQSRAYVLRPQRGDMLIFTTNFRPGRGTRGYHRVNMKHGVSSVHHGERHTLGIIFHDAMT